MSRQHERFDPSISWIKVLTESKTLTAKIRQGCRSRGAGGPYKGLNSPKMFKNLNVSASSGPQNEKWLLYRKQKSCLGCKLSFVFYTCLPHFTLGLTILGVVEKSGKSMLWFTEMLENSTCFLWIWILLSVHHDFLGSEGSKGFQGTHSTVGI